MANRRMFSREIVEADAFLRLPPSAQLLYFHLCMYADDDGFVSSPRAVCTLTRRKADGLRQLQDAGLIHIWDDGVVLVMDWLVHNQIRRDRYRMSRQAMRKCIVVGPDRRYVVHGLFPPGPTEPLPEQPSGLPS